jgi:3-methyl-2-oxobutanoate hydroxymethyltransferase
MTAIKKNITVPELRGRRYAGPLISMLTCYDACFAKILDQCEVDVLLVGDSLGMVLQGHTTTIPVTLSDMLYHTASVARARPRSLILADLPFGTYQESPEQAYRSASLLLAAGAQMVKLEGGAWLAATVEFLTTRSIPVCAHIGLTPQSINAFGVYRVQGRDVQSADAIMVSGKVLQEAGAEMLVAELIPSELGRRLTEALSIPTIGIGAGPHMNGQVLVLHDMLGISGGRRPRFVKDFLACTGDISSAVRQFVSEVRSGVFPAVEHGFEDDAKTLVNVTSFPG